MRTAITIIIVTLALGFDHGPRVAQASAIQGLDSIHMIDALTGWAVGTLGGLPYRGGVESILHTTDGGTHWSDVTPASPSGRMISPNYDIDVLTSLSAWVSATPDTPTFDTIFLFHTVDGGRTWRNVIVPARDELATGWTSVHFINPRDGWVLAKGIPHMGSADADIYRSTDGGKTWNKAGSTSDRLPGGQQGDITFLYATTGWLSGITIATDSLYLYVTHDGGRTWQHQGLRLPPQVTSPWYSATGSPMFFTARDGILPVFYPYKAIPRWEIVFYATHDRGVTWGQTTPVLVDSYWDCPRDFADINHGWVVVGDALYMTGDGGRHWATLRPASPFAPVKQIAFVSPQVGWAVRPIELSDGSPQIPPFLLKTVDGGRTWAPVVYTVSR